MLILRNARPLRMGNSVGSCLQCGVTAGTAFCSLMLGGRFGRPCAVSKAVCHRFNRRVTTGATVRSAVLCIIRAFPCSAGDGMVLHLRLGVGANGTEMRAGVLRCRCILPCSSCNRMFSVLVSAVAARAALCSAMLSIVV